MVFQDIATSIHPVFENVWWRIGLIVVLAAVVALFLQVVALPILHRLTRRSRTDVDDHIFARLRPPLLQTVFLEAIHWALVDYVTDPAIDTVIHRAAVTLLVLIWGRAVMDVGSIVFRKLSAKADSFTWIQPQTLPLVQFGFKILIVGTQAWIIMSSWNVSLTSWLASAGVVGIAVGFAAKDTLANLFGSVTILIDRPFQVGDWIKTGDVEGTVEEVGFRSTRIRTFYNSLITLPNANLIKASVDNLGARITHHLGAAVPELFDLFRHGDHAAHPAVEFNRGLSGGDVHDIIQHLPGIHFDHQQAFHFFCHCGQFFFREGGQGDRAEEPNRDALFTGGTYGG